MSAAPTPHQAQSKRLSTYRARLGTPEYVVNLARNYSARAIKALAEVLEDDQQPVAARIRCAEVLLDRAYGKAPQAMLVATTDDTAKAGVHGLTILERISQLRAAKDAPATTDLEASEVRELPEPLDADTELADDDSDPSSSDVPTDRRPDLLDSPI